METIEKQLTDYKGFQVWKVTDNKGLRNEITTYNAYTQNDDLFDSKQSLAELKKSIDSYIK
jgi:hypothetical protein